MTSSILGLALTAGCVAGNAAGQDEGNITTMAFLSGCWSGLMGDLDMREQWTETEAGVMLGTTRYFRDGALADFEFAMMLEEDGAVVLWPYPRGNRSPRGFPLVSTDGEYTFENLEHDFPVRIIYRRIGQDRLEPRIEGTDGEGPTWSLDRVPCPS